MQYMYLLAYTLFHDFTILVALFEINHCNWLKVILWAVLSSLILFTLISSDRKLIQLEIMCNFCSIVGWINYCPTNILMVGFASPLKPVITDVSILISRSPIKYPGALFRYALPVHTKAIREVQKSLEDIVYSLKLAGIRALESVKIVSYPFKTPCSKDLDFL